jgi:hypothetical protein
MTRIANQDFTLNRDDGRPLQFKAGDEIPTEFADHWFAKLHSDEAQSAEEDKPKAVRTKKP